MGKFKMVVKKGSKVKIEYEGTLDSGQVFDTSEGKEPLGFTLGEGRIIPGFEDAIIGMEKGQEKIIKISPEEGYGMPDPTKVQKISKEQFPEEIQEKVEPGVILHMQTPDGQQVPLKVAEVDEQFVILDLNHPLAGQTLTFKIKIVDVD